jgi:hypothetical protein
MPAADVAIAPISVGALTAWAITPECAGAPIADLTTGRFFEQRDAGLGTVRLEN